MAYVISLQLDDVSTEEEGRVYRRKRTEVFMDTSVIRVVASRHHIMKCMPEGSEATAVLVGSVDFLHQPIIALVRLVHPRNFGEMIEVPLPIKFVFLMLGPHKKGLNYYEIGRAMSTLMANEVSGRFIAAFLPTSGSRMCQLVCNWFVFIGKHVVAVCVVLWGLRKHL